MQKYMFSLFLMILSVVIMTLEGCATPTYENQEAQYKHHKFIAYQATGYASFYGHGDGFNGRKMADGKIFHANNLHVAAHPYLPLGTKLKVISVKTHKVLYVDVTDRMGSVHGRIIDLSYGASKYFGMRKSGIMKIKIKSVTESEYRKHVK